MANSLTADPVLRKRYQIWSFIYGSGNPLVQPPLTELRAALTAEVQRLDPEGTNAALRQMVVIGHSQGGLLTKCTAVNTGDRLWRVVSTNRLEDLKISDAERAELRRQVLPRAAAVRETGRVHFHPAPRQLPVGRTWRAGWPSGLSRCRAQCCPSGKDLFLLTEGAEVGKFFRGNLPTSLDGMSPQNPGLLAMAEIPVAPGVKAHSIVSIDGDDQPPKGGDGVVKYASAHVDYVESELIVRSYHTCLDNPATIEEVRRILHEHLKDFPPP